AERGGQGGGEDEFGRIGAYRVDDRGIGGDVAAHDAEPLGQRPLDDVDAVHQPFTLADAAAARAVHAHRVHLVDIGEGVELVGKVGELFDRRDVAIHRIDRFEDDQLGAGLARDGQQDAKVSDVKATEDLLFHPR